MGGEGRSISQEVKGARQRNLVQENITWEIFFLQNPAQNVLGSQN